MSDRRVADFSMHAAASVSMPLLAILHGVMLLRSLWLQDACALLVVPEQGY